MPNVEMSHCGCSIKRRGPEVMMLIDEALVDGVSMRGIERALQVRGVPIKAETVTKHLMQCHDGMRAYPPPAPIPFMPPRPVELPPPPQPVVVEPEPVARVIVVPEPEIAVAPDSQPLRVAASLPAKDLAVLVQQKAMEGLENGTLQVTLKDGLAATALIDKREARQEDRKFMVGLARLLSGAGHAGPQGDDPNIIDVTPANPLLAPESLRGDG